MMKIIISGQHIEISPYLKKYIESHVEHYIKRYFHNFIHAHVTITKKNRQFQCHVIVHEGETRKIINSEGTDFNIYACIAQAIHRMEERLQRYKDKLRDYHNKAQLSNQAEISAFLKDNEFITPNPEQKDINFSNKTASSQEQINDALNEYSGFLDDSDNIELVTAEINSLYTSNLEDAIREFELMGEPFHLFINSNDNKTYVLSQKQDKICVTLINCL